LPRGARNKSPQAAINRKNRAIAMVSSLSTVTFLCTCGRNAALHLGQGG